MALRWSEAVMSGKYLLGPSEASLESLVVLGRYVSRGVSERTTRDTRRMSGPGARVTSDTRLGGGGLVTPKETAGLSLVFSLSLA